MALCWDFMCGQDCAWCAYKQDRYRKGHSQPCYAWFRDRKIEKKCRECRFYLEQRKQDASLPDDPAWHPPAPG